MTQTVGAYKEPSHTSSFKVVICIFAIELIYIYWKAKKEHKGVYTISYKCKALES